MSYSTVNLFRCNTYKKHGGRGAAFPRRSDIQTCGRSEDPSVPLQSKPFGATIRKGAGILCDPGKQLRSPRCLRVRERTSGTVRRRSRLPRLGRGCKVIALRSHLQEGLGPSFYCWTAAGGPSIASGVDRFTVAIEVDRLTVAIEKDAGKRRAGKAGSVRLG